MRTINTNPKKTGGNVTQFPHVSFQSQVKVQLVSRSTTRSQKRACGHSSGRDKDVPKIPIQFPQGLPASLRQPGKSTYTINTSPMKTGGSVTQFPHVSLQSMGSVGISIPLFYESHRVSVGASVFWTAV